jgi:Zn-dependent protease with chaperone function
MDRVKKFFDSRKNTSITHVDVTASRDNFVELVNRVLEEQTDAAGAPFKRQIFKGLEARELQHPEDRATIEGLKRVPGIEAVSSKINELAYERIGRLELMASAIHVGQDQYSGLYDLVTETAHTLDMPVPELYVANSPEVNAYSRGLETPVTVLNSGLIDVMTESEIRFVIAHELGHIKCGHVRYSMMLDLLYRAGNLTGLISTVIAQPLQLALERWWRRSELSADRAGLSVVKIPRPYLAH